MIRFSHFRSLLHELIFTKMKTKRKPSAVVFQFQLQSIFPLQKIIENWNKYIKHERPTSTKF